MGHLVPVCPTDLKDHLGLARLMDLKDRWNPMDRLVLGRPTDP